MGMKLDTPLVKVLMVGAVVLCGTYAFTKAADQPPTVAVSYTDAARPLLAGRSDAELNTFGESVCKMYRGGSTPTEVSSYLRAGGASVDSADQLALIVRTYKCPDIKTR